MQNRAAFVDFVGGLLALNPLERWSPQQAKLHPFITQQKFTGPFVPPMNLKPGGNGSKRDAAEGTVKQQEAEASSRQRYAQHDAQIHAQQNASAYAAMQMGQYPRTPMVQSPNMYGYGTPMQGVPPPYPQQVGYAPQQQLPMLQPPPAQLHPGYAAQQQSNLHAQATTRAGRQRASTLDQQQGGIPASLQRVVSHLDPNAPIRLQPSPAYYPPPADGSAESRRRLSRAGAGATANRSNRDFIRTLEDQSIEEAYQGQYQQY
jgi:dual specificity protein kinase YAK1